MALGILWAKAAVEDLELAAQYIARDSPKYAAVLVSEALAAASSLDILSKRGRVVPEINDADTRELFVCNYRLIYRIGDDAVRIIAFIHGSRDLWSLWQNRRSKHLE